MFAFSSQDGHHREDTLYLAGIMVKKGTAWAIFGRRRSRGCKVLADQVRKQVQGHTHEWVAGGTAADAST